MKNLHDCDFCCTTVPAGRAYRVLAMESGTQQAEAVEFAFELCRPCYLDVGHAVCDLMAQILKRETALLQVRAQAAGVDISGQQL